MLPRALAEASLAKPSAAPLLALPCVDVFLPPIVDSPSLFCSLLALHHRVMPWLLDNTLTVGSPFFPLLTGVFGLGHWTAIQSANWEAAHTGGGSLAALWTEWLGYRSSGHWQWSVTPWLVLVGLGMAPQGDRIKDSLAIGSGLAVFVFSDPRPIKISDPDASAVCPHRGSTVVTASSRLDLGHALGADGHVLWGNGKVPTAAFGQAAVLDGRTTIPDAPPSPMADVRSLLNPRRSSVLAWPMGALFPGGSPCGVGHRAI